MQKDLLVTGASQVEAQAGGQVLFVFYYNDSLLHAAPLWIFMKLIFVSVSRVCVMD